MICLPSGVILPLPLSCKPNQIVPSAAGSASYGRSVWKPRTDPLPHFSFESSTSFATVCVYVPPSLPTTSETPPDPSGTQMPDCWSGCVVVTPRRVLLVGQDGRLRDRNRHVLSA